jgi:general secretion pathway protein A
LHLIIVGQPELRETLRLPELRQLTQRISVFYHIGSLSLAETEAYVVHRLETAGGAPDLFSKDAIRKIWQEAHGVPRLINTLCDLSLVYGFSSSSSTIDCDVVDEVLADRKKMGLEAAMEPASGVAGLPDYDGPAIS